MKITSAIYYFDVAGIGVYESEITRETPKCYFTEDGERHHKDKLNKPILYSATNYPYIMVTMVDADQPTLKSKIREWFDKKANEIAPKN